MTTVESPRLLATDRAARLLLDLAEDALVGHLLADTDLDELLHRVADSLAAVLAGQPPPSARTVRQRFTRAGLDAALLTPHLERALTAACLPPDDASAARDAAAPLLYLLFPLISRAGTDPATKETRP